MLCSSNNLRDHRRKCSANSNILNGSSSNAVNNSETEEINSHNALFDNERKLLPIVPVVVISGLSGRSVKVNCLLDSGCDTTMATKRLSRMLNI